MPRPVGRGLPGPGAELLVGVSGAKPPRGGYGGQRPPRIFLNVTQHKASGKPI